MRIELTKGVLSCFHIVLIVAALLADSKCRASESNASQAQSSNNVLSLSLVGYNYTDRHISDYSVNGTGGANVFQSSPSSGGSGVTCCVTLFTAKSGAIRVKVRWQVDGCTYVVSNPRTGATQELTHFFYKEKEVEVTSTTSGRPSYLETHFYPDGSAQVQLTENISRPRLALDENRPDKSSFPRCKDGKKPR